MNHVTGNKERKKRQFSRKSLSKFMDGNSIRNYYEEFFFLFFIGFYMFFICYYFKRPNGMMHVYSTQ